MKSKSWLFPPRPIGKRRAAALIAEHNALVDRCARLEAAVRELLAAYARGEAADGSMEWEDVDYAYAAARKALPRVYEQILAEVRATWECPDCGADQPGREINRPCSECGTKAPA